MPDLERYALVALVLGEVEAMSRPAIVAAGQLGPASEDKAGSAARMARLVEQAAERGAQLVVFPELSLTPYFAVQPPRGGPDDNRFFDPWPPPAAAQLLETARRKAVALVLPFGELDTDGARYNSAAIVDREGVLKGFYRKVHTPAPVEFEPGRFNAYESIWFYRGNLGFPVYDVGPALIGAQICYDRHFPESSRALALGGAEILALSSNSPVYKAAWRRDTWDIICRMRAYENVVFLVAANKVGPENGVEYIGRSCIVSPLGQILAQAETQGDEIVVATLDLDEIANERKRRRYIEERQPDQYTVLVRK